MAAPADTTWGAEVNSKGKIGIYREWSDHVTFERCVTQVWFWSKWGVSDSSNTFSYGVNGLTNQGSRSISHTVSSGSGWSTSNQTLLGTFTHDFAKGTSQVTHTLQASLSGIDSIGGTMTASRSYTVYTLPTYTVTFVNGYGGTISSQTVYHGYNATAPANPTRTGYTFAGWSGTYTGVTSSRTITATWKPNTYTITFNPNGGTLLNPGHNLNNGTNTNSVPVTYGSSNYYGMSGDIPTRTNYLFKGWYTAASGGIQIYTSGGICTNDGTYWSSNTWKYTGNLTVYAQWELTGYVLTYDDNGGTGGPGSQLVVDGNGIISNTIPKRQGYTFTGWAPGTPTSTTTLQPGYSIPMTGDITLYAKWESWTYSIMFNANGGYGSLPRNYINLPGDQSVIIGDEKPSSVGGVFLNWNTKADGTGITYNSGDLIDLPESSSTITIYAMYYSTDIYFNSDCSIECLEFIEDENCLEPFLEPTGKMVAREFIEHDGDIMFESGIIYARCFIEKELIATKGKCPTTMYKIVDMNRNILINNSGYTLVGYE